MPFFLIAVGLLLVASAINNKAHELGDLWKDQFTGQGSFANVVVVLFLLGALGAVTNMRPLAVAFMGLFLLVFFLGNAGTSQSVSFVSKLRQQLTGYNGEFWNSGPSGQVIHYDFQQGRNQ